MPAVELWPICHDSGLAQGSNVDQQQILAAAGSRIRALREGKGLSQEALSLNAEVDQSTLSKAERLGPHQLSWSKLLRLAEALDCTIELNFVPRK